MSCSANLNVVYSRRIIGRFEVPTGVSNKITVLCDVIQCSLIYRTQRCQGTCCLYTIEDRVNWFSRKVYICLPKYTTTHPQNIVTLKDVIEYKFYITLRLLYNLWYSCFFKSYPSNRPWRPIGLWDVEVAAISLDSRFTDGCKVVSLTRWPPITPQEDSWYSFLL
jgi:hypothetical protein